ncbi:hypothetical protein C8J57DRAFT_1472279 [Mycena rebaudengoi]|nr:hypothetical protein C8J57DRAFT_1472279 [Mycena rebaudengoi]
MRGISTPWPSDPTTPPVPLKPRRLRTCVFLIRTPAARLRKSALRSYRSANANFTEIRPFLQVDIYMPGYNESPPTWLKLGPSQRQKLKLEDKLSRLKPQKINKTQARPPVQILHRMTGGGTGACLQTMETGGMGEGWSDALESSKVDLRAWRGLS